MPLKIVRNDITLMQTDAIVNTANSHVAVGSGCDYAVYQAAGYDKLMAYRRDRIGEVPEGEAFITPGFDLAAKYIIHVVSPRYKGGDTAEEEKLRASYRNSLKLVSDYSLKSVSFPLISTGSFGYPKEEGLRIAADEINAYLLHNDITVYLVIFDEVSVNLGKRIYPDLEEYIDLNFVIEKTENEYVRSADSSRAFGPDFERSRPFKEASSNNSVNRAFGFANLGLLKSAQVRESFRCQEEQAPCKEEYADFEESNAEYVDFEEFHADKLEERMKHLTDTFSEYLMYLISDRHMKNADVYNRAVVDKKTFSKIKNNPNYHPQKLTALCLCVGAKLNLDESKDLLARAGYALSPCDKTDIIFSYFIENEIYDIIELDIQLEEHGLPCIIN